VLGNVGRSWVKVETARQACNTNRPSTSTFCCARRDCYLTHEKELNLILENLHNSQIELPSIENPSKTIIMPEQPSTLDQLPDEILQEILEWLSIEDSQPPVMFPLKKSIRPLAFCNRRLLRIALPMIYRTVHIFTMDQLDGFISHLIKWPQHGEFVMRLTIDEVRGRVSNSISS
jgi:hypothetical protein